MHQPAPFGRLAIQHLSLGRLLQFGEHLRVEHPVIDAQHSAIFQAGVDVYEQWRRGGGLDALQPAVEQLAHLVQSHFAFEERALEEAGYEALPAHVLEHREMLEELSVLQDRLRRAAAAGRHAMAAPGEDIMRFVLGLTVGHVGSSDMPYRSALAAKRPPAAEHPVRSIQTRTPTARTEPTEPAPVLGMATAGAATGAGPVPDRGASPR